MHNLKGQKILISILLGLISLAWLSLLIFGHSPNGRLINHERHMVNDNLAGIIFIVSWVSMIVAMMLPSSLPLIIMFKLMVNDKYDRVKLISLLIIGYIGIWLFFGVLVNFIDRIVHTIVYKNNIIVNGSTTIILTTAGLYQFTNLKYYCVSKCRSPKNFIIGHWQGGNEKLQSFRLGIDHGIFCIGCCWSLMLIMFLVGIGNIGWMLILAIIMMIEKNYFGRWFGNFIGICLIGLGILLILV